METTMVYWGHEAFQKSLQVNDCRGIRPARRAGWLRENVGSGRCEAQGMSGSGLDVCQGHKIKRLQDVGLSFVCAGFAFSLAAALPAISEALRCLLVQGIGALQSFGLEIEGWCVRSFRT